MIVLICGYSASGKTSVVRYISKTFNLDAIYTSTIFKKIQNKSIISYKKSLPNLDIFEKNEIDLKRGKSKNLDLELDKYLLNLVKTKDGFVSDSWTLPYLTNKGVKIWLNTSCYSRSKRLAKRENISFNDAIKFLNEKDKFSEKQFKKLYNINFGKDLSNFDLIVNTDNKSVEQVNKEIYNYLKSC